MTLRALLFDLDGVLVHSYEVWLALVQAAARDLSQREVTRESFHAGWGQGLDADVERWFPGRSPDEIEAYYTRHFRDHATRMRVDPDAARVFAALRARGLGSAVITNTPGPLAREILAAARLAPDVLVGGRDVPRAKPAPDMVLRACTLLRAAPAEALVVGDTEFDRAAARAAGVRFAGLGIPGDWTLARLGELEDRLADEACAAAPARAGGPMQA